MGKAVRIFFFVTIYFRLFAGLTHNVLLGEDGLPLCMAVWSALLICLHTELE